MGKNVPQLVTLVRQKASVENNQVVTDDEVMEYLNEGRRSFYDLIVGVDASYAESRQDYTLASSPTGAVGALPSDFYRMRGLVRYPDSTREYPIFQAAFSERGRGGQGRACYTLDGDNITISPWSLAGDGPWRLYYTPKAPQFVYDFAASAATIVGLPSYTVSGGGTVLTATANGTLSIDGVTGADLTSAIIKDEADTTKNGFWIVAQVGSAGTPWILNRGSVGNGFRMKALGGSFNAGQLYTSSVVTEITTAFTWVVQALNTTEDNFDEYIVGKAVVGVFGKRQMPGAEIFEQLFAMAEQRVRAMASGRASEPEQAPILWRGRRHRSVYDDYDDC